MNFNQREVVADKLNVPIKAVVKPSLYRAESSLYTPQIGKLEGYTQFPRPKDIPYANHLDPKKHIERREALPKNYSSVKTMKVLTQTKKSFRDHQKIYGDLLTCTIPEH